MKSMRYGPWVPFQAIDLRQEADRRRKAIADKIDRFSNDEVMANDESLLVQNLYEEFCFFPVIIHDEDQAKRKIEQQKISIVDRMSYVMEGPRGKIDVDGVQLSCFYPFEGDQTLFDCQASTFSLSGYPDIEIVDGCVVLRASFTLSQMRGVSATETALSEMARKIGSIRQGIEYANRDAESFNQSLIGFIQNTLQKKKANVQSFFSLATMFNVPISQNDFAINHISLQRKRCIRPISHHYERKKVYCIEDQDYYDILSTIKHFCSTFESTPSTYSEMGEEKLRSVLLSLLNASYNPLVTGETFRVGGKTDIQISVEEHAAFIAECKMWAGPSAVEKAVLQLDAYLTWRDIKTAIIYFVRNKNFIQVLDSAQTALRKVPGMVQVTEIDKNEFDCYFDSKTNAGQRIRIRVFLFNMNPGISKR